LEKIPKLIEKYKESNEKEQKDVPVLQEVVNGTWRKEAKLKELKSEMSALERKIQLSLAPQCEQQDSAVKKEKVAVMAEPKQKYRAKVCGL